MNAARRAARAGRNLLIALAIGAVIIVAIVVAYMAGRTPSVPVAEVPDTPSATSSSGAVPDVVDAAPTGCLGGGSGDTTSVLRAQKEAPHTTYGAVEVAAAFFRWGYRYPLPTRTEVADIGPLFQSTDRATQQQKLRASFESSVNPANGVVEDGTAFRLSTVNGGWIATPETAGAELKVSIQAGMVIDGAISPTKTSAEAFAMTWDAGAWRISRFEGADPRKLSGGATAFTAGC